MQEDLRRSAPQEETQALPETRGGLPIPQRLRGRVGKVFGAALIIYGLMSAEKHLQLTDKVEYAGYYAITGAANTADWIVNGPMNAVGGVIEGTGKWIQRGPYKPLYGTPTETPTPEAEQ